MFIYPCKNLAGGVTIGTPVGLPWQDLALAWATGRHATPRRPAHAEMSALPVIADQNPAKPCGLL
jgi:hypothetical protein